MVSPLGKSATFARSALLKRGTTSLGGQLSGQRSDGPSGVPVADGVCLENPEEGSSNPRGGRSRLPVPGSASLELESLASFMQLLYCGSQVRLLQSIQSSTTFWASVPFLFALLKQLSEQVCWRLSHCRAVRASATSRLPTNVAKRLTVTMTQMRIRFSRI